MRRPTEADGWPYGRLPWARGLRVARTARAHTRSVGGRAADNPRLVAHGQASSQGWRQNKSAMQESRQLARLQTELVVPLEQPAIEHVFFGKVIECELLQNTTYEILEKLD